MSEDFGNYAPPSQFANDPAESRKTQAGADFWVLENERAVTGADGITTVYAAARPSTRADLPSRSTGGRRHTPRHAQEPAARSPQRSNLPAALVITLACIPALCLITAAFLAIPGMLP